MQEQDVIIGLDIGTTSTKAVAFDSQGQVVAAHSEGYPLVQPRPNRAEQDPEAILQAVITGMRSTVHDAIEQGKRIIGVGFSSAMHSVLALDQHKRPLTRLITWADNRSANQVNRLKHGKDGHALYRRTGTPLHPMSVLPKLMWLREQEPETFAQAATFVSIKEYILYRLFQEEVVDFSIASGTGLFSLSSLEWDEEALAQAGIRREQLGQPVPTTHVLRGMDPDLAHSMGLSADTPWVIGAGDGVLANLGTGAISPGETAVTVGTSGALRQVVNQPVTDMHGRTFCYALTERHWVIGGPANNGGILLRWLRRELGSQESENGTDPYAPLIEMAARVPAGAEGVVCLPYLTGERAPHWNDKARGAWFGLSLHHGKSHMIRAMLEGMVMNLYAIYTVLEELTGPSGRVLVSGGMARYPLALQMMADVFEQNVLLPEVEEASAMGAAALALVALGYWEDIQEVKRWIAIRQQIQPAAEHVRVYRKLYSSFQRLYEKTESEMEALAGLQIHNG
ncbi:gluconate kinase [Marinithermofilum abyssi]|uniref:Gluconate kinase n=1 Tax=Marinithermofilum abyssi TaxID=1571185 RepID=A0A8J2YC57_9BACL|nr:gluconokinase [Marinithermofilum abyssi]GGE04447.1 gluconate kinase [Marinithermofilum abyssi]